MRRIWLVAACFVVSFAGAAAHGLVVGGPASLGDALVLQSGDSDAEIRLEFVDGAPVLTMRGGSGKVRVRIGVVTRDEEARMELFGRGDTATIAMAGDLASLFLQNGRDLKNEGGTSVSLEALSSRAYVAGRSYGDAGSLDGSWEWEASGVHARHELFGGGGRESTALGGGAAEYRLGWGGGTESASSVGLVLSYDKAVVGIGTGTAPSVGLEISGEETFIRHVTGLNMRIETPMVEVLE